MTGVSNPEEIETLAVKVLGVLDLRRTLILLVPEVGLEPTRACGPLDFESSASTSFTTPARESGQRSHEKVTAFEDHNEKSGHLSMGY